MFGDAALGELNLKMVAAARSVGAAAKFTGSGGAIVAYCPMGEEQEMLLRGEVPGSRPHGAGMRELSPCPELRLRCTRLLLMLYGIGGVEKGRTVWCCAGACCDDSFGTQQGQHLR